MAAASLKLCSPKPLRPGAPSPSSLLRGRRPPARVVVQPAAAPPPAFSPGSATFEQVLQQLIGGKFCCIFLGMQAGGPAYPVELGRLDGLVSTASNVDGNLPPPSFNLDQLTAIIAANNLSQDDMIALSAAHTVP